MLTVVMTCVAYDVLICSPPQCSKGARSHVAVDHDVWVACTAGEGTSTTRRGQGDIARKFNYAAVDFSAENVFRSHDADHSGTIDAAELEQVRGARTC